MQELIFIFFLSLCISYIGILVFERGYYRLGILDNPQKYGKKRAPIPYSMGVVLFLAFFLLSYFFVDHSYKLYLIWFFGALTTTVSFIDDRLQVSAKVRLVLQILIGGVIGLTSIKIGYVSNIFWGIIDLETYFVEIGNLQVYLIPLVFTIIWYVFIFNALNWTDGIEGNTSGLSIISFLILFLLGAILFFRDEYAGGVQNAYFIMSIAIILVGILIPFWYFDVREKILMGDSGTMFLGFMLATLAIISWGKIATVLVVFGMYSVDAVYVLVRRILAKKDIFRGDYSHLHHRLLDIGLSKIQILVLVYSLSFFFGITALFLDKVGKIIVFSIIVVVVVFLNTIIEKISRLKK